MRTCEWVIRYHGRGDRDHTCCTRKATHRAHGFGYCAFHARETRRMAAVADAAYRIAGLAETTNVTSHSRVLLRAIAKLMALVTKFDAEDAKQGNLGPAPVLRARTAVPYDDEPETDKEREAVDEARSDERIPHDEVKRRLGLL